MTCGCRGRHKSLISYIQAITSDVYRGDFLIPTICASSIVKKINISAKIELNLKFFWISDSLRFDSNLAAILVLLTEKRKIYKYHDVRFVTCCTVLVDLYFIIVKSYYFLSIVSIATGWKTSKSYRTSHIVSIGLVL